VHKRTTLRSGEHSFIDRFAIFFFREDDARTWTAQSFMRSGSDDICVFARVWINARRDETGVVSHIDEEDSPDRIGNLPEAREIDDARISASAGDNHLRLMLFGQFC